MARVVVHPHPEHLALIAHQRGDRYVAPTFLSEPVESIDLDDVVERGEHTCNPLLRLAPRVGDRPV
jgi:hypothetical protein